jgi:myo-inositol-1(or 4)-monophosphatase
MAAGICILREAGGTITSYDQTSLDMDTGRLLATNSKIHSQLSQALEGSKKWFQEYYGISRLALD